MSDAVHPYEISKKELLAQTGISYGQLYRWKREGLIPEEWFEKRSSFTGQETFFPREYILERIKIIQSMKDDLSLSEIKERIESGEGQPTLHKILSSLPDWNEEMVDKLGIDLDAITVSEFSLKAIALLAQALTKADASPETTSKLIAQSLKALDISAQSSAEQENKG